MKIMLRHKVWFCVCLGYIHTIYIVLFGFGFRFLLCVYLFGSVFFYFHFYSVCALRSLSGSSSISFLLMSLRPPAVCHIEHISNRKWQKNLTHNRTDTIKKNCVRLRYKRGDTTPTKKGYRKCKTSNSDFQVCWAKFMYTRFGHYTQQETLTTPTHFLLNHENKCKFWVSECRLSYGKAECQCLVPNHAMPCRCLGICIEA